MHIGSQILDPAPHGEALRSVVALAVELRDAGHPIRFVDAGGGYGVDYREGEALPATAYADVMLPPMLEAGLRIVLEPGRFIMGNAGILVTRVLYVKESGDKVFVVCDAGMNDLIRPSLYEAYHRIWTVDTDRTPFDESAPGLVTADVVGPVCESGDYFARDRRLPRPDPGDFIAIFSAGAYGHAMASNYNSRPRPPEILVDGERWRLIRRRETSDDMWRCEEGL